MATREEDIVPRIYHANDPDEVFELWRSLVMQVADGERTFAAEFIEIFDPDTAPEIFVDLQLASLGNPFISFYLTLTQKRKLVKFLIPIYRQKGTGVGIVNAVRFLTGIELEFIDPHGVETDGWEVGLSEVGENNYVGGERVYCNLLSWSEDFTQSDWVKTSSSVISGATDGPLPWVRAADEIDMSAPGAKVGQQVTPLFLGDQDFTGSIWLKAFSSTTIRLTVEDAGNSADKTEVDVAVTTEWQRFEVTHTINAYPASTDAIFSFKSVAGYANPVYAWGAQLVRHIELSPYTQTTDDGEDCSEPGRWAYHFILVSSVILTENQDAIIRQIADYMKTAHTHYTLIDPSIPDAPDLVDHWEVGLSEVGINTYVH